VAAVPVRDSPLLATTFPYAFVFDAEPTPLVLALAHAKRRPGYWKKRRRP